MHVKSLEDTAAGIELVQHMVGVVLGLMIVLTEKTVAAIVLYVVVAAADETTAADVAVAAFAAAVVVNTPEWLHQICILALWPSWRAAVRHWHRFLGIELAQILDYLMGSPLVSVFVGVAAVVVEG